MKFCCRSRFPCHRAHFWCRLLVLSVMVNGKLYGSLRDEKIYCSCDIHIFTNSRKRRSMVRARYSDLKCNHLWFYGEPHSRLQTRFGDLMQGDWNHVDISCIIDHWARYMWNAYVLSSSEFRYHPTQFSKYWWLTQSCSPLLSQNGSHMNVGISTDSDTGDPSSSSSPCGFTQQMAMGSLIANPFIKRWLHFQSISTVKENESNAKKYAQVCCILSEFTRNY